MLTDNYVLVRNRRGLAPSDDDSTLQYIVFAMCRALQTITIIDDATRSALPCFGLAYKYWYLYNIVMAMCIALQTLIFDDVMTRCFSILVCAAVSCRYCTG